MSPLKLSTLLTLAFLCILSAPARACLSDFDGYKLISSRIKIEIQCRDPEWVFPIARKLVNFIFGGDVRQIAVIAGVSRYPALGSSGNLDQAHNDIVSMKQILWERLYYDEIIILENESFSKETLDLVFQSYFPDTLAVGNKARVLFTFSGHGAEFDGNGYIFLPQTKTLAIRRDTDSAQAIDFVYLKGMLGRTIFRANQFLALINSCNGGHFLDRSMYLGLPSSVWTPAAHAITAGQPDQPVGAGSLALGTERTVFFDLVVKALNGGTIKLDDKEFADPAGNTGVLDVDALALFIKRADQQVEAGRVQPNHGPLLSSKQGGRFFFVTNPQAAAQYFAPQIPAVRSLSPEFRGRTSMPSTDGALTFDLSDRVASYVDNDWIFKHMQFNGMDVCAIETSGVNALNEHIKDQGKLRQLVPFSSGYETKLRLLYFPDRQHLELYYLSRLTIRGLAEQASEFMFGAEGGAFLFNRKRLVTVETPNLVDENYIKLAAFNFLIHDDEVDSGGLETLKNGDRFLVHGFRPATMLSAWAGASYDPSVGKEKDSYPWSLSSAAILELALAFKGSLLFEDPFVDYALKIEEIETRRRTREITSATVRAWTEQYAKMSDSALQELRLDTRLGERQPVKLGNELSVDLSRFTREDIVSLRNLNETGYEYLVSMFLGRSTIFRDELSLWGFTGAYDYMMRICSRGESLR